MCRTQKTRTLADRAQIERELEQLWQFHLRRLKTGAPVNQLFDRAIFSQKPPLQVVQCIECHTVFRNPRERPDELIETYEGEEPEQAALASLFGQQLEFFKPRVHKITQMAGRTGSVLEVGSYIGGFLRASAEQNWEAIGLDINARANAFARSQGAQVIESSLDTFEPARRFDVVALWNCFDQLPDPHSSIRSVSRLLNDNGIVVIRVPNGACYAALRNLKHPVIRAMLAWNNLATFPYRHGFTPYSLTRLLKEAGYRVIDVALDALVPISGPWTRPWAALEERVVKRGMRLLKTKRLAPWFEVYARRSTS